MQKVEQEIRFCGYQIVPDVKVPKYTNWYIIKFGRLKERKRKQIQ